MNEPGAEAFELEVVVEIPRGARNKYEMDHESGTIWLDRTLFTATQYPADYGFVPHTLGEDGDPIDVLVLLDEPTFPGCHVIARPIGVFRMRDEAGGDDKVLVVPAHDPRYAPFRDLSDVRAALPFLLHEIEHFFHVYKDVEPGKSTEPGAWEDAATARRLVGEARARYSPVVHGATPS
jgi:inorganic pyrophosphatase